MFGGDDRARPVAVDRAALEDPVGPGERQGGAHRKPLADVLVAVELILAAPAVEAEALRAAVLAATEHDRPRVAQPDVAERFDDYLGERAQFARGFGRSFMRRDQPDLFASAVGVNRLGERRDFALGGLEVAEPQLGIARKADPQRLVRRPFGKRRSNHGAPLATKKAARESRLV